jgi:hypothetical protein
MDARCKLKILESLACGGAALGVACCALGKCERVVDNVRRNECVVTTASADRAAAVSRRARLSDSGEEPPPSAARGSGTRGNKVQKPGFASYVCLSIEIQETRRRNRKTERAFGSERW